MKMLSVAIASAALMGVAYAQTPSWTPDQLMISAMEANLSMPTGRSLSEYARYYAGQLQGAHHVIFAEFIRPMVSTAPQNISPELRRPPGVYLVSTTKQFPGPFDGGCSVIHFTYDTDTQRFEHFRCNGGA